MRHGRQRSLSIDGLKALAVMLIVLHHLAFYGPMADRAGVLLPRLRDWLAGDARMAVQVFLVVGGFLAARSLSAIAPRSFTLLPAIRDRFLRLALPYYVVLVLAVACNTLARRWMSHDSISAPATAGQLLAHALLLQDVLGYESLSAGLWYVAIDLQLFMLLAVLWRAGALAEFALRKRRPGWETDLPARFPSDLPALFVSLMALASLLYFNRSPAFEPWGVYFFGSYALGALAWWASGRTRPLWWLIVIAACTTATLLVAFRERLVLALLVAMILGLLAAPTWLPRLDASATGRQLVDRMRLGDRLPAVVHWLAANSYAIFLVHFPVSLVVNAGITRFAPSDSGWQLAGIGVAVAASVVAGAVFHAWVETPLLRCLKRRPVATAAQPRTAG